MKLFRHRLSIQLFQNRGWRANVWASIFECIVVYDQDLLPCDKRTGVAENPLRAGEKLGVRIDQQLQDMKKNSRLVRSLFKTLSVSYIAASWVFL